MAVYLDHAATTPMLPEAAAAYLEAVASVGNPSSIHSFGQRARQVLEDARERIAFSLGCDPVEVVLTSGGTEAINLALKGLFWARDQAPGGREPDRGRPVVVVPAGEHHATIDAVEWLQQHEGAEPRWVQLDREGRIEAEAFDRAFLPEEDRVAVATSIWVNNEVGTVQPVDELCRVAGDHGVPLHLDAVAAYGHVPIDFRGLRRTARGSGGLVALSVSAHKVGGPVGVGALVVSRDARITPLIHGGGQQRHVRSGSQDVAAAVAFAVAATAASTGLAAETERVRALRDRLVAGVLGIVPDARLTGPPTDAPDRVASNAHFLFPGAQGDSLLFLLDVAGIAVSTGSACQAGVPEPSHVVLALGYGEQEARSALRVTLGRSTTEADVDAFLAALPEAFARASRAGSASRTSRLAR